jgi:hypothetical protein
MAQVARIKLFLRGCPLKRGDGAAVGEESISSVAAA